VSRRSRNEYYRLVRLVLALILLLAQADEPRAEQDLQVPRGSGKRLAAANDLVRNVPLAVRCDLIRTMFSEQAFESLSTFLAAPCTRVARMGRWLRVEAGVATGPTDDRTGITPTEPVFPEPKQCEGPGYVVNPKEAYWASNRYFIYASLTSVAKRSYDFNLTVGFPNGVIDCGGVSGHAVLKDKKWTISESK
jgi:hypothetical protein